MRLEEPAAELEEPRRLAWSLRSSIGAWCTAWGRGQGEVWESARNCGMVGTLPLPLFLGLHAVLSTPAWGWDEQSQDPSSPSHQPLALFFPTMPAAWLGRPLAGDTHSISLRVCCTPPLSLWCPNPVHAAFLRGSSCCPLV